LKNEADINIETNDGLTSYDIASQANHKEVAKIIMNHKNIKKN
jgi:hypothetical protein